MRGGRKMKKRLAVGIAVALGIAAWLLAAGVAVALGKAAQQQQQPSVVPTTDEQKVDLTVS